MLISVLMQPSNIRNRLVVKLCYRLVTIGPLRGSRLTAVTIGITPVFTRAASGGGRWPGIKNIR